jgi:hypothetical protein
VSFRYVSIEDYFRPLSDLNLVAWEAFLGPGVRRVAVGDFLPYCNPHLRPAGDFVSRTLLTRASYWEDVLTRFSVRCQSAVHAGGLEGGRRWTAVGAARRDVREASEQLRDRCLFGAEARLRGACVALVQVLACYRPCGNLGWLGLPPGLARGAIWIRHRVEQRQDATIPDQIAGCLAEVAPLVRGRPDPEALVEERRQTHLLLVVTGCGRREVYWRGEPVPVDWSKQRAPWDLLIALAEQAQSARGADALHLDDGMGGSAKDRRYRLRKLLPQDLSDSIAPAGRNTYRLALARGAVCLLRFEDDERLEDVRG